MLPSTYLSPKEAAGVAGVSVSTIRHAIRAGQLRAGRAGSLVRIKREWLDEWLSPDREQPCR